MVLINDNSTAIQIGDPMPHFSLPATDGLTVDSSLIKDPVLIVVFTCNHCPYAKAYDERLVDLANDFDQEGAQLVCISSNDATEYPEDSFACMQAKHAEGNFPFPYCYDESQEVAKAFGALCTPHCFVFDQDRNLQYKGRIDDNWKQPEAVTERSLYNAVRALLDGDVVAVPEANAIGCSIKWK